MKHRTKQSGFTLLEIMVAVSILAIALLVILDLHSGSMLTSMRAEEITTATMLARLKIREIQLDVEKDMAKGEFPSDKKEMEGKFDEPFERYTWKATIGKVEIPVPPSPQGEGGEEAAGMDVMLKMFQIISEKIGEAAREIRVDVVWDELGEEQSVSMATHIVKL